MAGYGLRGYGLDGYGISAQIFTREVSEQLALVDGDIKEFQKNLDEDVRNQPRLSKSAFLVRSETAPLRDNLLDKADIFVNPAEQLSLINREQFVYQTVESESLSVLDEKKVSLNKSLDESQEIQDRLAFTFSTLKQEALTVTDELAEKAILKPLRETSEVNDQLDKEAKFLRNIDQILILLDSDILDLSLPFVESTSLDDNARKFTAKDKQESIQALADLTRRIFLEFDESVIPEDVLRFKLEKILDQHFVVSDQLDRELELFRNFNQKLSLLDTDTLELS